MQPPLISVWISTRNAGAFIAKCLASLRSQTVTDWEAVFIDDASTDATWEHAQAAIDGDPRIRAIRNTERVRQVGAFFQAFPLLRAQILVELDGDDRFCRDDALAQILACYEASDEVDATSGRNHNSLGFESLPWKGSRNTRQMRFLDLAASMCAPRSWRRSLTERALREIPEVFYGPDGRPWQSAGDLALFGPVLYYARAIPATEDAVYEINMGNPESDWVKEPQMQQQASDALREMWRLRGLAISAEEAAS